MFSFRAFQTVSIPIVGSFDPMETLITELTWRLDSLFILFYRMTGHPFVDYLVGTFVLAIFCVVGGEISISWALRFNRKHIDALADEMKSKERLSVEAYRSGDKRGYQALNREATDAWGKHFFTMAAYGAGILWPIPFALGWMQTRFSDVTFPLPLIHRSVSYPFVFIPLYVLARMVFGKLKPHLPYFRQSHRVKNPRPEDGASGKHSIGVRGLDPP
jgi:hypothetical protein